MHTLKLGPGQGSAVLSGERVPARPWQTVGMLPMELGRHRGGDRSVAIKRRMGWEFLVPARGSSGLVCRWLFGGGKRRGRDYVRAKQIPFPAHSHL